MKRFARWLKQRGFALFLGAVMLCLGAGVTWLRGRAEQAQEALRTAAQPQETALVHPLNPAERLQPTEEETAVWSAALACWTGHAGWDLACKEGAPVYAAHAGTVIQIERDRFLGNLLRVRGEEWETVYAGLSDACSLREGQRVEAGAQLGTAGTPGLGEPGETHLHLEAYKTAATMPATTSDAQARR